ncbi:Gfo/Idh/MocA family oxidoreductase [Tuanshanicoccus lijuaniae]|uniref:Gfo/Idh/MocA family protein n=1 Tax=Aerococcaceae bacterium zg-1292 TaxID=2774330 RepID=UPI0019360C7F|nr:Gfo/Idh/MocA family oxidoreductase [Aerococcaceae bacterium zg-1292]QQA36878.1 Gfo/Idh/MocA family oxidoreductase [Aerococcaceae bacterium zg-1292]
MTENKLHFGIIGFGFMGQTHAKMITNELDYAKLVAVCDINKLQLENATGQYETYLAADDLLRNDVIDTVIIAVPNHLHLEMVKKVAAAGKNIICEKPAAMNAQEFEEMLKVTREAGVHFTIHHQRRWDKDFNIAKEIYQSGTLGKTYTIQSSLYGFNGNMHDWHIYPEFGGGMLYDWGIHLLDQILFMVESKIESVYATVKNVINKDVDDYFNIQLQFENGVTGQIELGTYFLSNEEGWFERHWFLGGDEGSAKIDGFHPHGEITRTTELLRNVPGKITMTAAGPTRSFGPAPEGRIITERLPEVNTQHRDFFDTYYEYVSGKRDLVVKPEEILRLMKLMDSIRISAKEHQSVSFE